jgi:hypothetical protein
MITSKLLLVFVQYVNIIHTYPSTIFIKIITKYREFIQHVRNASKSIGQASVANSIVLIPIAANAINELNNILNRLTRIAFTIEAESNYLRQPPIDNKEFYRQDVPTDNEPQDIPTQYSSGLDLKEKTFSVQTRSNIRNQSAISSTTTSINSFKLTSNMISNIFEDFFINTNDLFD